MLTDGVTSEQFEIRTLGAIRRYLVIRPARWDPGTIPVVVDLHGSGSWPEEHAAVTEARAYAALGAVIVVPQAAISFRMLADWPAGWAWNVPGSPLPGEVTPRDQPDDAAFIRSLVTRMVERHGVDPRRIHLRGYSGGARLASHLMARMGDQLNTVCCVAGVRFIGPSPGRLPPLLAIHGGLDAINPYLGDGGPRWAESVESAVSQWAIAAGCALAPRHRAESGQVREARYVDADGVAAVRLVTIADAGHSWPGTRHGDHVEQFGASGSWDASRAHWEFVHEVDPGAGRNLPNGGGRPSRGDVTARDGWAT
jgi:polyhydroxybutyrate depolymerase